MTRTEAPFCWFVDFEMRTLDRDAITVWLAMYAIGVESESHACESSILAKLDGLTKAAFNRSIATLLERDVIVATNYDGVMLYEAIEPSMNFEKDGEE